MAANPYPNKDAKEVLEFTERLLEYLYTMPEKVKRAWQK